MKIRSYYILRFLKRYLDLFILIIINAIMFLYIYMKIGNGGMLVYGDLPAFYLYGPLNYTFVEQLTLYPISVQLLSYVIGPVYSQNIIFIFSFLIPSIGIDLFLREFTTSVSKKVVISLIFGTIINPIIFGMLLGGGFEYGFWLFFTFISLKYIVKLRKFDKNSSTVLYLTSIAAIFFALSITSTGFFIGAYISVPYIILFYIYSINNFSYKKIKILFKNILIFFIIAISVMINFITQVFIIGFFGIVKNQTNLISGRNIALGNIIYLYRYYNIHIALFNGVYAGPLFGYLTNNQWYFLILMSIMGGAIAVLLKSKSKINTYIYAEIALYVYLFASIIMVLFHIGLIDNFYLSLVIFDSMDFPGAFTFMQVIGLPVMLLSFIVGVESFKKNVKIKKINNYTATGFLIIKRVTKQNRHNNLFLIFILFIIVVLISNNLNFVLNVNGYLTKAQGAPYVNKPFFLLHDWYENNIKEINGKIFVLPNSYFYVNGIHAVIPSNYIWNLNFGLEPNESTYNKIINLLYYNNVELFANYIGLSGVQFVILFYINGAYQLDSYYNSNYNVVYTQIHNSSKFLEVYKTDQFVIFYNKLYVPNMFTTNSVYTFKGNALNNNSNTINILNQMDYGAYVGTNVSNINNGSIMITGPSNSETPYTELWYHLFVSNGSVSQNISYIHPILNHFETVEYAIKGNYSLLINKTFFDIVAYYYNSSYPSSFYGYFSTQSLFNSQTSNKITGTFDNDLSIPQGTASINIVLISSSTLNKNVYKLILSNISLLETISATQLENSTSFQDTTINLIESHNFVNESSIFISRLIVNITGKIIPFNIINAYPAYIFENKNNINLISISLKNKLSKTQQIALFITGTSNKTLSFVNISDSSGYLESYHAKIGNFYFNTTKFYGNPADFINVTYSDGVSLFLVGYIIYSNLTHLYPNVEVWLPNSIVMINSSYVFRFTRIITDIYKLPLYIENISTILFIEEISVPMAIIFIFNRKRIKRLIYYVTKKR